MKPFYFLFFWQICVYEILVAQTWNAFGNMTGTVTNILVDGNEIYVTGTFTNPSGEVDADYLARWSGDSWQAVAPNVPVNIWAIIKSGDDIYIAGHFTNLGGNPLADWIVRWDGKTWHPMESGPNGPITDMAFRGNHLYVVGSFSGDCDNPDPYFIAYWDGSSWNPIRTVQPEMTVVRDIAIADDGKVYIGGSFSAIDGIPARNVAWWDEDGWHALGTGFYGDMGVTAIAVDGNDVYVGGDGGPGIGSCGIARWDGSEWHPLAGGVSTCLYGEGPEVIAASNGNVYVGGLFNHAGNVPHTRGLAHWDGSSWNALGTPMLETYSIQSITIAGDDVYVGGSFLQIAGVPNSSYIARWGEPIVVADIIEIHSSHHNNLSIFPNPADGIVRYQLENAVLQMHSVTMTNPTGRVILEKESEEWEINVEGLPAGVYFLQVQCGMLSAVAKIVKE